MKVIAVSDQPEVWRKLSDDVEVVNAHDYLAKVDYCSSDFRVINLTSSYKYQSVGYYVSLLSEARHQKVFPTVTTILDFKSPKLANIISSEIDEIIQKSLKSIQSCEFVLSVYFGMNLAKRYEKLSRKLHQLFPAPMFRVIFVRKKHKWSIKKISLISIKKVPDTHFEELKKFLQSYYSRKRFYIGSKKLDYDLTILCSKDAILPPSNQLALDKFVKAGSKFGLNVSFIDKGDFASLQQYDALFIRETTAVNHYTYLFARRAVSEGLIVVDEPDSILRCANKVYLSELLSAHKLPVPKACVVSKNDGYLDHGFSYPCVLKLPDSCYSQGVVKISDEQSYVENIKKYFSKSDLVLMQEFVPTEFDWRIGVFAGRVIYACKYYMVENHWQIYNWGDSQNECGNVDAIDVSLVPADVLSAALKATSLIGESLYGVDIKVVNGSPVIIEVNDNPNIDAGIEDEFLGDALYENIMQEFRNRIRRKHQKFK